MPIEIACDCGRPLKLRDELAGKVIRCPACAGTLQVPLPAEEVVEEVAAGPPPLPPALPQRKVNDIGAAPPLDTPRRPKEPKQKKKKKSVYSEFYGKSKKEGGAVALEEGWFGSMNSGIIGGAFSLLVGIALLVAFIYFGAPIRGYILAIFLIVVGLGGMLKGLIDLYE